MRSLKLFGPIFLVVAVWLGPLALDCAQTLWSTVSSPTF